MENFKKSLDFLLYENWTFKQEYESYAFLINKKLNVKISIRKNYKDKYLVSIVIPTSSDIYYRLKQETKDKLSINMSNKSPSKIAADINRRLLADIESISNEVNEIIQNKKENENQIEELTKNYELIVNEKRDKSCEYSADISLYNDNFHGSLYITKDSCDIKLRSLDHELATKILEFIFNDTGK